MEEGKQETQDDDVFKEPVLPLSSSSSIGTDKIKTEESTEENNSAEERQQLDFRYQEPIWAKIPTSSKNDYYIEVIREGAVVETILLHNNERQKSYWAIGRFEPCDIKLEHPSVSRFHAILQYGECVKDRPGWFLFDLNSTHGTKLNKNSIKKRSYIPLHAGYVFRIAGSSRLFSLCGGPTDEEDSLDIRSKKVEEIKKVDEAERDEEEKGDDYIRYYAKEPMSWLQKYFEREGAQMQFQFTKATGNEGAENIFSDLEDGQGKKKHRKHHAEGGENWICTIELISDISLVGGNIVSVSAPSRKLAQQQCALVACERLDNACLLQISSIWNKRKTYAENDYYDSDEDTFFDRTGQIEEQREKRRERFGITSGGAANRAKNYDDLLKEIAEIDNKLEVIRLETAKLLQKNKVGDEQQNPENEQIASKQLSFSTRMALSQMKGKEKKLLDEKERLGKLAEVAKPTYRLPSIAKSSGKKLEPIDAGEEERRREENREREENKVKEEARDEEEEEDVGPLESTDEDEKNRGGTEQIIEGGAHSKEEEKEEERDRTVTSSPMKMEKEESVPKGGDDEDKRHIIADERAERIFAPALPPREQMAAITPKFGMLTKEEMVRMKLLQRQKEREAENRPMGAVAGKKARFQQAEEEEEEQMAQQRASQESREKYATWLPPEDQSGDGSTRLNAKFAGRY